MPRQRRCHPDGMNVGLRGDDVHSPPVSSRCSATGMPCRERSPGETHPKRHHVRGERVDSARVAETARRASQDAWNSESAIDERDLIVGMRARTGEKHAAPGARDTLAVSRSSTAVSRTFSDAGSAPANDRPLVPELWAAVRAGSGSRNSSAVRRPDSRSGGRSPGTSPVSRHWPRAVSLDRDRLRASAGRQAERACLLH